MALASTQDVNRIVWKAGGTLGGSHDNGGAAIRHQRTVQQMQRVCNHTGIEHIFHADEFTHLRRRIARSVPAAADRHGGHLLRGGAVGVHVGACNQGIKSRNGGTVRGLKFRMTGRGLHLPGLFPRQSCTQAICHGDQHGFTNARHNRRRCVLDSRKRGSSASIGADAIAGENLQVFSHGLGVVHVGLDHGIAGDQPIDLVFRNPGVVQRAACGVNAKCRGADMREFSHFGVGSADNSHFSSQ